MNNYQSYPDDSVGLDRNSPFLLDHLSRYYWAADQSEGKTVLDVACGHGMGTFILAQKAAGVVGIDLNQESLAEARAHFSHPSIQFAEKDVLKLYLSPELKNRFDVITAFEVIEHLPQSSIPAFLKSLSYCLKPTGVLLISTPNHRVVGLSGVKVPDFHINNYDPADLKKTLIPHFSNVQLIGQYRKRKGLAGVIFEFDFLNLRHRLKLNRIQATKVIEKSPSTPERLTREDLKTKMNGVDDYVFSKRHWRQAGLSLVRCQKKQIHFYIHDLNPWGGQDRSTLEIAHGLSKSYPVHAHSFTLEPLERPSSIVYHPVPSVILRPVFLKSLFFQIYSIFSRRSVVKICQGLLHCTGTCALQSELVHIQFIHNEANRMITIKSLRSFYQWAIGQYEAFLEHLLFRFDRHYIVLSHQEKQLMESHFGLKANVSVIPHGIDTKHFHPLSPSEKTTLRKKLFQKSPLPMNTVLFTFVGEYTRKGLETALEAFASLAPELRAQASLVAIGNGNHSYFEALIKKLQIADCVRLISHQKNISDYYSASDVFVLPSRYEPFGLVALEAAASGCACIFSKAVGASDLFIHQKNALLLNDAFDAPGLAHLMEAMIRHPDLRERLAREARVVAEQNPWSLTVSRYEDLLLSRGRK